MNPIYILIKQIGDLKEILPEAYTDYNIAFDKANTLQLEIHAKGYTDFKVKIQTVYIN